MFCEVATRTRTKIEGRDVDHFEIDWNLVRLLFDVRDYNDTELLTRTLIALLRSLNSH